MQQTEEQQPLIFHGDNPKRSHPDSPAKPSKLLKPHFQLNSEFPDETDPSLSSGLLPPEPKPPVVATARSGQGRLSDIEPKNISKLKPRKDDFIESNEIDTIDNSDADFNAPKQSESSPPVSSSNDSKWPRTARKFHIPTPDSTDVNLAMASKADMLSWGLRGRSAGFNEMKLYKKRWFLLILFILLFFINNFVIFSIEDLPNHLAKYFQFDLKVLDILHISFAVVDVVMCFLSIFVIEKFALRFSLLCCGFLCMLSGCFGLVGTSQDLGWSVFVSVFFAVMSQSFVLVQSSMFVSTWFGDQERTKAASLIWSLGFCCPLAICGYFLPLWNAESTPQGTTVFYKYFLGVSSCLIIIGLLNVWFQEDCPVSPPSVSADTQKVDFATAATQIFQLPAFVLLLASWGLLYAIFYSYTLQARYLFMENATEQTSSYNRLAVLIACSTASLCSIATGIIVDKFRNFKIVIIMSSLGTTLTLLSMIIVFTDYVGSAKFIICPLSAFFGAFVMGSFPIAIEFGIEITFPMPEQLNTGLLLISGKVIGFILYYVVKWVSIDLSPSIGLFILAVCSGIATTLSFFIRPEYRRLFFEQNNQNIN